MRDSLRRDDMRGFLRAEPSTQTVKPKLRTVTRYAIMYTTANGDRRQSRKLYERGLALKLVGRLNRAPYADAYADRVSIKVKV